MKNEMLNAYSKYRKSQNTDFLTDFINELIDYNEFFVVVKETNGKKDNILGIANSRRETYIPLFTDPKEIKKWKEATGGNVVKQSFDDICFIINKTMSGFVINPFSDNILLPKNIIMNLKVEKENKKREIGKNKHIGQIMDIRPIDEKNISDKTKNSLLKFFSTVPKINNVWFVEVKTEMNPDDFNPMFIIDSELSEQEMKMAYNQISIIVRDDFKGKELSFIKYDEAYCFKGKNFEFYKK